jgi:hypothetical protein
MRPNIAQVTPAPTSTHRDCHVPIPAAHPDKVDTTATIHMVSLVDAYKVHSGCPPPQNLCLRPRAPGHSIAQFMYQRIFDRGGPLALKPHQPVLLCRQWYLQADPADAAVLAMLCCEHLCKVILVARLPPTPPLIPPVLCATPM